MNPVEQWLETEIGRRFPDGETLKSGQLRVRVAHLCFDLLDHIAASRKERHAELRARILDLCQNLIDYATEVRGSES